MAVTDYYTVLGVEPESSQDDIKRAFRRLARQYHPDATGGDDASAERYKQISEAYSVLSDPERRRQYDSARMGGVFGGGFGSTIEDIFETFFGGGVRGPQGPRTRARRGEDVQVDVELEFAEAVFGTKRTVEVQRYDPCTRCTGTGCEPGSHPVRCDHCGGSGQVQQVRRTMLGQMVTAYPCAACEGTGQAIPTPCSACRGSGRVPEDAELPIEIPPGIEDGDRLRLTGSGEAGTNGGPRGDLYVRFFVQPDERFVRSGDDLVTWVDVPMTVAALGGEVVFETLDGEERLTVDRGTQSGSICRVRGRGQPRRGGRGRGDLIARVHVVTPSDLDGEQERLLRELAERRNELGPAGKGMFARLRRALGFEE